MQGKYKTNTYIIKFKLILSRVYKFKTKEKKDENYS